MIVSVRVGDWPLDTSYHLWRVGWEQGEYHETAHNRRSNTSRVCQAKENYTCRCGMWLFGFTLLVNSVSFFLFFPSVPTWTSAETLPHRTVKLQHTLLETTLGAGRFCLPHYWSFFVGRKYREKIVQHMLQAIAFSPFPHLLHRKGSAAPAALAAGACYYFLPFPLQPHPLGLLIMIWTKTLKILRPFSPI